MESDVEAYYCQIGFLEVMLGCTQEQASGYVDEVLAQHAVPIREQFDKQRTAHNRELYAAGGSPTNDVVWAAFQAKALRGGKGKFVFRQLKNKIPNSAYSEEKALEVTLGGQIALDLKHGLEQVLAA